MADQGISRGLVLARPGHPPAVTPAPAFPVAERPPGRRFLLLLTAAVPALVLGGCDFGGDDDDDDDD
jgi:hypothetical protein